MSTSANNSFEKDAHFAALHPHLSSWALVYKYKDTLIEALENFLATKKTIFTIGLSGTGKPLKSRLQVIVAQGLENKQDKIAVLE